MEIGNFEELMLTYIHSTNFRKRSTVWWCPKTFFSLLSLFKLLKIALKYM